jgi:hypothetical protein
MVTSLYPDAWRILQGSARRLWRRDAAVATVLSVAAATAIDWFGAFLSDRFHSSAPVGIGLFPDPLGGMFPAAGFFFRNKTNAAPAEPANSACFQFSTVPSTCADRSFSRPYFILFSSSVVRAVLPAQGLEPS